MQNANLDVKLTDAASVASRGAACRILLRLYPGQTASILGKLFCYGSHDFNAVYFFTGTKKTRWETAHTLRLLDLVQERYEIIRNQAAKKGFVWQEIARTINDEVSAK